MGGTEAQIRSELAAADRPRLTIFRLEVNEARRLLYVSLTRARKKLLISACDSRIGNQRYVGDREVVDRTLTRFLRDYGFVAETADEYLSG